MTENLPEVVVLPPPTRKPVDKSLSWIGFGTEGNCNIIQDEGGLESFDDFVGLTESSIRDMASGFSKSTPAQVHINFGMQRIKYTLGIMHWTQYESRYSQMASLTGIYSAK